MHADSLKYCPISQLKYDPGVFNVYAARLISDLHEGHAGAVRGPTFCHYVDGREFLGSLWTELDHAVVAVCRIKNHATSFRLMLKRCVCVHFRVCCPSLVMVPTPRQLLPVMKKMMTTRKMTMKMYTLSFLSSPFRFMVIFTSSFVTTSFPPQHVVGPHDDEDSDAHRRALVARHRRTDLVRLLQRQLAAREFRIADVEAPDF